jgi:hypothetical protein
MGYFKTSRAADAAGCRQQQTKNPRLCVGGFSLGAKTATSGGALGAHRFRLSPVSSAATTPQEPRSACSKGEGCWIPEKAALRAVSWLCESAGAQTGDSRKRRERAALFALIMQAPTGAVIRPCHSGVGREGGVAKRGILHCPPARKRARGGLEFPVSHAQTVVHRGGW